MGEDECGETLAGMTISLKLRIKGSFYYISIRLSKCCSNMKHQDMQKEKPLTKITLSTNMKLQNINPKNI